MDPRTLDVAAWGCAASWPPPAWPPASRARQVEAPGAVRRPRSSSRVTQGLPLGLPGSYAWGKVGDPRLERHSLHAGPALVAAVESIEHALDRVRDASGHLIQDKFPVPGAGWSAYSTDPEGNTVGLFQNDPDFALGLAPLSNSGRRSGLATEEGDQPCLHIGVGGYLDFRTVVPTFAQYRVEFVDSVKHASNLGRVKRFVEAARAGEVPGVNEHVGEDERHHGFVYSMTANDRMVEVQRGLVGVVQQRLDAVTHGQPRRDRILVDGGTDRKGGPGAVGEEGRHPLDEVPDDIQRHPPYARRRE